MAVGFCCHDGPIGHIINDLPRGVAMPIYEYECADELGGCDYCKAGFEHFVRLSEPAPDKCPRCGLPLRKKFSLTAVGSSKSGLDQRAKAAGFTKLKKLGKGEYEKQY